MQDLGVREEEVLLSLLTDIDSMRESLVSLDHQSPGIHSNEDVAKRRRSCN